MVRPALEKIHDAGCRPEGFSHAAHIGSDLVEKLLTDDRVGRRSRQRGAGSSVA
jgi:hypothetical protein